MRVIIAGSRDITSAQFGFAIGYNPFPPSVVVSGMARGVDTFAVNYAEWLGVPADKYYADWDTLGKRAGYLRNEKMAENADALFAIWDGVSRGTKHMIDIAKKRGLEVQVFLINPDFKGY